MLLDDMAPVEAGGRSASSREGSESYAQQHGMDLRTEGMAI